MTDRVVLSAGRHNIEQCVELARTYNLGIELMAFAFPDVLDGDWKGLLEQYRVLLRRSPGPLTLHGPFMDMAPGSPDRLITLVCQERYQHAIRIAAELGVQIVVFHANFLAAIQTLEYRLGWQKRNVQFWGPLADYARRYGLMLAVENMWEVDPDLIGDVVKEVAHPNLRICLDVAHAHLFGDKPFEDWLTALNGLIVHVHLNNTDGKRDLHYPLGSGVLNYRDLLKRIRMLPMHPTLTLEMDTVAAMEASLPYLDLERASEESQLSEELTPSPDG